MTAIVIGELTADELEEQVYDGDSPEAWVHLVADEDDDFALCGAYVGDDIADWTPTSSDEECCAACIKVFHTERWWER